MSYDEFLERLRNTPRTWRLYQAGQLRIDTPWLTSCPITATAHQPALYNVADLHSCAKRLGLSHELMLAITRAGDNTPGHDPAIRRDLLRACGLDDNGAPLVFVTTETVQ